MFHFLDDFKEMDADICIIGSGFAGLSIAAYFLEKGIDKKVTLFESSEHWHGKINAYAYGISAPKDPHQLYAGFSKGWIKKACPHYSQTSRALSYGGTANIWSGWSWPFEKRDFYKHPKFQWPFRDEELLPYYHLAQSFLGLGSFSYDNKSILPPFGAPLFNTRYIQFHPVRPHHLLSTSISHSKNVQVIRNATFVGFEKTDSKGKKELTHALFNSIQDNLPHKKIKIKSRVFVFGMGTLENTRQLLIEDLGNKNSQVGKNFMEHFYLWEGAKFSLKNTQKNLKDLYFTDNPHSLENGTGWLPSLVSSPELEKSENINSFRIIFGSKEEGKFTLNICCEQDPNLKSQIRISENSFDLFGRPRLIIDPHIKEKDKRTIINSIIKPIEYMQQKTMLRDCLFPDFNEFPFSWNDLGQIVPGNHPIGTTRLSNSPEYGVADANCKVFDTENLYLTGSGCFPTGGSGNPTFTIVALAFRLAAHLESLLSPKTKENLPPIFGETAERIIL